MLEALIARGRTGEGRAISVSLFSSMAEWMTVPLLGMEYSNYEWPRLGLTHPFIAPYGVYPTSDKVPVLISIQNDREFERLCHGVIDRPGLEKDPDYATARHATHGATTPTPSWPRASPRRPSRSSPPASKPRRSPGRGSAA